MRKITTLRRALELEQRKRFEQEAAQFFATGSSESQRERAAYQKATKRVLSRD